jgi:anoctamin-10
LYFAFLSFYTNALIFPTVVGVLFYLFGSSYSAAYSTLLFIWSVVYVEWWRVQERILSLRWGTRGSFRVEKQRPQYKPGLTWWQRDLRVLASIPVIIFFAGILAALLTAIFFLEAFVMELYKGPGQRYVVSHACDNFTPTNSMQAFSPTILFTALVPRVLSIYHMLANRLTSWENHRHRSSHNTSLTLKSFALSAIVSYLGLALSAFLYVPFGEAVMHYVQGWLYRGRGLFTKIRTFFLGGKGPLANVPEAMMWESDISSASKKLNRNRLKDQMFAYTVTEQVVNTFSEIGLPYLQRFFTFSKIREEASKMVPRRRATADILKDDGPQQGSKEEEAFIHVVEKEAELVPYDLFEDYSEMVTQFGYVALWSTIWPLAPGISPGLDFYNSRAKNYNNSDGFGKQLPRKHLRCVQDYSTRSASYSN